MRRRDITTSIVYSRRSVNASLRSLGSQAMIPILSMVMSLLRLLRGSIHCRLVVSSCLLTEALAVHTSLVRG